MDGKLSAYRTASISGQSQLDLLLTVYDGAIVAFRAARQFYDDGDLGAGHEQLQKARRFVTHLYTTLDPDQGGEVAANLGKLYAFVINQISVAEATKDLAVIDDNITILSNVRAGWVELKQQENAEPAPAPAVTAGCFSDSG
ncbi:MAG: flagellar export chaperone FliS [bacterium]